MPLLDISNPYVVRFLSYSYEKTNRLIVKWNQKHRKEIERAAVLNREFKGLRDVDVFKATMVSGMAVTTREYASDGYNRRTAAPSDSKNITGISSLRKSVYLHELGLCDPAEDPQLGQADADFRPVPKMRPVKPEHKKILYDRTSSCVSKLYLKNRNKLNPEDKYYFSETSSWQYGWRLKDSRLGHQGQPVHGHVQTYKRDFMSRKLHMTSEEE